MSVQKAGDGSDGEGKEMNQPKWTLQHEKPRGLWNVDYSFMEIVDDDEDLDGLDVPDDCGSTAIFDEETGDYVAVAVCAPYDFDKLQKHARLIAAAPEMAEALKEALTFVATYGRVEDMELLDRIDAALAKAGAL